MKAQKSSSLVQKIKSWGISINGAGSLLEKVMKVGEQENLKENIKFKNSFQWQTKASKQSFQNECLSLSLEQPETLQEHYSSRLW